MSLATSIDRNLSTEALTHCIMVLWVFGYGSLLWRTGFNYEERVIGYVKDYKRVFHQGSTDHRGTVEKPGRTVNLEKQKGAITWGAAYRVSGHDEEMIVTSYLDVREKSYDKALLDFYTVDASEEPMVSGVLTYIVASPSSHSSYLGAASMEDMATQIATAHGPSGPNHEYLFNLEESLREIGVECVDADIVALANEVRKVLASLNSTFNTKGIGGQLRANHSYQLGGPGTRVMLTS